MSVSIATMGMYGQIVEVPVPVATGGGYGTFTHKKKPSVSVSRVVSDKKDKIELKVVEIREI